MRAFSALDIALAEFERDAEARDALRPAEAWPAEERTEERRSDRVVRSLVDFWAFDSIYFSPEQYVDYAAPGDYHRALVGDALTPGVAIQAGPRDHGKTVTLKKLAAWLLLTKRVSIMGTLSQTLPTASNILRDVSTIIRENPRIVEDWGVQFAEDNKQQIQVTTTSAGTPRGWRFAAAFSEGKSVRGYARDFGRPEWILADDIETLVSPLGEQQVQNRIRFVGESYLSMTKSGTLVWIGNVFDERCALNRLAKEQAQGVLQQPWRVTIAPAWSESGPLWPERFPAATEAEMRALCRARDEADWQGNFQQRPVPPEGIVFLSHHYQTIHPDSVPKDTIAVCYADQNLALKGMGDTTGMLRTEYSPSTQKYYVRAGRCKSYNDPNILIDDYARMRAMPGTVAVSGFDGHVSQESTWTSHIRNWARLHGIPMFRIQFCRYRVDLCAVNTQTLWTSGRIVFVEGWAPQEEAQRALRQLFGFSGKKTGKADDFPDGLICSIELLHEIGIAKRFGGTPPAEGEPKPTTAPYRRPLESPSLY